MKFCRLIAAATLAVSMIHVAAVQAQSGYPSRTVKLVVGFPGGVPADVMARIIAPKLSERLGQPVIVENKPGASSNLAADQVAKSEPDGHTIFISSIANSVAQSASKLPFDLVQDFAGVLLIADVPGVLVAHPSVPATLRELVAKAKEKPDAFAYGSSGSGSSSHLYGELLNLNAGIKLLHVPYRGSSQTLTDLIAGRVQMFFSPTSTVIEHVKNGSIRALAVLGKKRLASLPDVPTFTEAGFEGFETSFWFGVHVPKATPAAIVQRLNEEFRHALSQPDVQAKMRAQTIEPMTSSSAEFDAFVKDDVEKWARVVKAAGVKPQ